MLYADGIKYLKAKDDMFYSLYEKLGYLDQRTQKLDFASFVSTIVGQQLSVKAAKTILERLQNRTSYNITPKRILEISPSELRKIGISQAKVSYICSLANDFSDCKVSLEKLSALNDDSLFEELNLMRGIGPWSARILMLFNFHRLDSFPFGDATLNRAFCDISGEEIDELPKFAKNWSPFAGIVAMYMWSYIDQK